MSDEVHPEAQECALIVSQEGRPQQVPTNFPGMNEELSVLVGSHHSVGDDPDPLVCLVHLADNICKDLGLGCTEEEQGMYDERVLARLRISGEEDLSSLRESLGDVPDLVRNMVERCF